MSECPKVDVDSKDGGHMGIFFTPGKIAVKKKETLEVKERLFDKRRIGKAYTQE